MHVAERSRRTSTGPLRVAHLTTVDMSLDLLLAAELRSDVEVGFEVFGISAPGRHVPAIEALGVTHVAVANLTRTWSPSRDLRAASELFTILRRLRLDVLHTHTPKAGVLGRVTGRAARVPVVVDTCHGLWMREDDGRAKKAAVVGIEAIASYFAHFELYQNADDRHALRHLVRQSRSRVVGNGVDLLRFRFDAAGRERVRAELGVRPGEHLVGGVGRRAVEKGIAELGASARALEGRARFAWVGPTEVGHVPEPAGLTFVEERTDMAAVYSAFDVFVLPSHREGFSRSAMEAAACGRAMVLSDIRGCREIGEHDRHLLLVPPHDVGALTDALRRVLDDHALRHRLGEAARQRALREFDQRRVAQASIDTYRLVAARRGLPWPA